MAVCLGLARFTEGNLMKILEAAEADISVLPMVQEMRKFAAPALKKNLAHVAIASGEVTLYYVPIIMDKDGRTRYPARHSIDEKKREISICPQLNYEIFCSSDFKESAFEYVMALKEACCALSSIGASQTELKQFNRALKLSLDQALTTHSDAGRNLQ
ncbi:MAG: hypothetical protein RIG84_03525 [Roseovarius sp.]